IDSPASSFQEAGEGDFDLLVKWYQAFAEDIGEAAGPHPDAREQMRQRLAARHMFLWRDPGGQAVTMAGWSGRTPNGTRVNAVYTPPENRRRGYASACVAS